MLTKKPWWLWAASVVFFVSAALPYLLGGQPSLDAVSLIVSKLNLVYAGIAFCLMFARQKGPWTFMIICWLTSAATGVLMILNGSASNVAMTSAQIALAIVCVGLAIRYFKFPYINVRSSLVGRADRHMLKLPVFLQAQGFEMWGVTECISATGLVMKKPSSEIQLPLEGLRLTISGADGFESGVRIVSDTIDLAIFEFTGMTVESVREHLKIRRYLAAQAKRLKQSGYSLIEMMVVVGISSVALLGTTQIVLSLYKVQTVSQTQHPIQQVRFEVFNALTRSDAWVQTLNDPANTSLDCVRNRQNCGAVGTAKITRVRNVQNNVISDSMLATAGFDRNGVACNSFSATDTNPNSKCPFRLNATWHPVCDSATCLNPQIVIDVSFLQNEGSKKLLNAGKFSFSATVDVAADQLSTVCTQTLKGTFDASTLKCSWTRFNSKCEGGKVLTGFDQNGTPLCQAYKVQTCPSGKWVRGFDADGSVICQGA